MPAGFRVSLAITALLIVSCMAGVVTAASIGTVWKESIPFEGSSYNGLKFTADGERIFAGGSQLYLRSWDGEQHWGGHPGFISTISADGNYVVLGQGKTVMMLFKNGDENWSRNMNGEVSAVAVSKTGDVVVSADNQGNINIWDINGDLYARNQTDQVKKVAISPNENLVVATTVTGLKYFNPVLTPIWFDTKNGSIDTDIIFSADGSTIITSGGKRVSSHTSSGRLNWMNDVSKTAILDIACSYDCSVIVVGTEDGNVKAIDRYGVIHWTYPVGQWINSVAVSRDASVIAAAGIDRNLYILDLSGKLQTKRLMSTIIHTQSVAVSPDGRRIVVADERALNGLTYTPDPDIIETVPTPVQVTTQYTYTPTTVPITERTTMITPVTTEPVTAVPTPTKSPLNPAMALIAAVAGLALIVWRRKS